MHSEIVYAKQLNHDTKILEARAASIVHIYMKEIIPKESN